MPPYQSLYVILGISKSASADEVRKAYRKKALETHPDKLNPRASEAARQAAEAQFHLIHSAFETLSDPHRRKAYDAWGSKVDPKVSSEESAKRMADRNQWASGFRADYERRKAPRSEPMHSHRIPSSKPTNTNRTSSSTAPRPHRTTSTTIGEPPQTPSEGEEKIISEILQQVRAQLPPEYEERRRRALQKKAERERAEMRRHTVPV